MKFKLSYLFLFMLWIAATTACSSDDDPIQPTLTFSSDVSSSITVGMEPNSKHTVAFNASHAWEASVNANWVVINPNRGQAGENQLSILVKEKNKTGERRTATLSINAAGAKQEITLVQEATHVLEVNPTSFDLKAKEQDIEITFQTNLPLERIQLASTGKIDWITLGGKTRALNESKIVLHIAENATSAERKATFILRGLNESNNQVLIESAPIKITQAPGKSESSTDYTQDKVVTELQKHTLGNGIPLVFMGDGFLDKDISSGHYLTVMKKALDNFFTEEPVKSLKEYFDIWAVNAVSEHNNFGPGYSTKFSCRLEGGGSTLIEGDDQLVLQYAQEVPAFKSNPNLLKEATCIVVLNTEQYAGTCYFGFGSQATGEIFNTAIGYCPMINGMEDDMFRRVLCHECIGHGFAKLLDEYGYQEMGRIPTSEVVNIQQQQRDWGWGANVDFTSDPDRVIWSRLLKDARYQGKDNYGETLSVYEGSCTYATGAYRPTNESMMRSNMHGFNAPSREAIYKRVMQTGLGSPWQYDYEEFVTFDQAHLPTPTEGQTRATAEEATRPFAAPVFTNQPLPLP